MKVKCTIWEWITEEGGDAKRKKETYEPSEHESPPKPPNFPPKPPNFPPKPNSPNSPPKPPNSPPPQTPSISPDHYIKRMPPTPKTPPKDDSGSDSEIGEWSGIVTPRHDVASVSSVRTVELIINVYGILLKAKCISLLKKVKEEPLTPGDRKIIRKAITAFYSEQNLKLTMSKFRQLVDEITELFPNEMTSNWTCGRQNRVNFYNNIQSKKYELKKKTKANRSSSNAPALTLCCHADKLTCSTCAEFTCTKCSASCNKCSQLICSSCEISKRALNLELLCNMCEKFQAPEGSKILLSCQQHISKVVPKETPNN
ncbi:disheveled-associated activator of morphogenesis 1-A-like [Drosophila miranda]|uniref:disheveled-associated activator of morphogenesis 1-A-like n=1 Tax=Drosophila miranda TaxID=7229 RepID=UPI0007E70F2F|nr:disheveled-associated activator of morphogenesis 1-A-like [Drosophila miranda]XP_033244553.1 disheveled-associated activator of morphogenesis 1-A-like [Drosophila miranda]